MKPLEKIAFDPTRAKYLPRQIEPDWVLTDAGLYVPRRASSDKLRAAADARLLAELAASVAVGELESEKVIK